MGVGYGGIYGPIYGGGCGPYCGPSYGCGIPSYAEIILVLFILLVIILNSGFFI